ncbi:MAG: PQQ-binding-like beta-propeller repeat protein [bacterium]
MKKLPLFILIGLLGFPFLLALPLGKVMCPRAVASNITSARLAESAWPCRGHDPGHTGLSSFPGVETGSLKWTCQTGGSVYSSPVTGVDATVYIGSSDGRIYALDPVSGSPKWSYQTGGNVYSTPGVSADGTVFVGSLDGMVYAIRAQDGGLRWSYKTGKEVYSSPAIGPDGTVYVGSLDDAVYALNPESGSLKWSYQTGDDVYSSPALSADGTVYVGSMDGAVYALHPQNGSLKWKYQTGGRIDSSPAAGEDGTIYVGNMEGRIYALKGQDGSLKWSYKTGAAVSSSPALGADGTVYAGSLDGRIYALKAQDGSLKWSYKTGAGVSSSPALSADGTVYAGSLDGRIYALKALDGSLKWSYKTGAGICSSPAIGADGTVYVGSLDTRIYAFGSPEGQAGSSWPCWRLDARHTGQSPFDGAQSNTLKWSLQAGGAVYSSPAVGAGGTIYIGSYDYRVYALNPDGGGLKWSYLTAGSVFSSPAIGDDGTIYVASLDNKVYALKPQDGSPKWIYTTGNRVFSSPAVGPDGTVYIGSLDSLVYALKAQDGTLKWSFKTGDRIYSSPAVGIDATVYIGSYDGKVYALNATDGSQKWSFQTKDAVYSSPAIGDDGTIYVGGLDGNVYALDPGNGSQKWSFQTAGPVYSSPAVGSNGVVYIGSLDGKVYALKVEDGSPVWNFQTKDAIYSSPALDAGEAVYIASLDGMIYGLKIRDGGLMWSYQTGSGVNSSPAIGADGTVYSASSAGKIFAFSSDRDKRPPKISCPDDMSVSATASKTRVNFTVTAADDVDPNPAIAYSHKPGTEFPLGITEVNVSASDFSKNISFCSFRVTVKDIEPPKITCPADMEVPATGSKTRVGFKAEAIDNVDPNPKLFYDHLPDSEFPLGTETVKIMASDASQNSSFCTFRVTVKDKEPPQISCPSDLTVKATGPKTPVSFEAKAVDNVDPFPRISYDHEPGFGFSVGTTRILVTATDASGNASECTFAVTVIDDTPPQITCPAARRVKATGPETAVFFEATAVDSVDPAPRITCDRASGSGFPVGTTQVLVEAADASGNASECTFDVTVIDDTPPQIICPPAQPAVAKDGKAKVEYEARAIDNVDSHPRITFDPPSGFEFSVGTTEVTVTATDASGNASTCSFPVTVTATEGKDTLPPQIACPADQTVQATGRLTTVYYEATATDGEDPHPVIAYDPEPGSGFPVGPAIVQVTASDASGNASTCSFQVTVIDTVTPQITCEDTMTVSATGEQTIVSYTASAIDNVDLDPRITFDPPPGSEFSVGTTPVIVTATDSSGNSSSHTLQVTVKDDIPPVIICPDDKTGRTPGSKVTVNFEARAIDNADPAPRITYDPPSGSDFYVGRTEVMVTAADASGNASTCSFWVTVTRSGGTSGGGTSGGGTSGGGTSGGGTSGGGTSGGGDTTPPVIHCPGSITVPATGSLTKVTFTAAATATDNADPQPRITYEPASGSGFRVGTTQVLVTAIDASNNKSTCSFQVTVKDTEIPKLTCPENITAQSSGTSIKVEFTASAIDNIDPSPAITFVPASGSEFPPGTTPVRVTATDSSGNAATCTFQVKVNSTDTTPPLLTCPENMTVSATGTLTRVYFTATATDTIDPSPRITYDHAPGSQFPVGTTWVRVTATDASGNSSSQSFQVTVKDTISPVIICPENPIISATGQKTRVNFAITATDNADPNPRITCYPAQNSEFSIGTTPVRVTATDASGNTSTCDFTITLKDNEPPLVTLSLDDKTAYSTGQSVSLDEKALYDTTQSIMIRYTVTDGCDPDPVVKVEIANNGSKPVDFSTSSKSPIACALCELAGQNVVTLTAIDACGNVGKASVDFEVALKLDEGHVSIKPEILRIFPGAFTVSLTFPSPYDASTIYEVIVDGAQNKDIVYNPRTQKAICDFLRSDIPTLPVDPAFEVTGFFRYKGAACRFIGSDTIRRVLWPSRGTRESIRLMNEDCQWPFCWRAGGGTGVREWGSGVREWGSGDGGFLSSVTNRLPANP